MRGWSIAVLLVALAFQGPPTWAADPPDAAGTRIPVAVTDLVVRGGIDTEQGLQISELLRARLVGSGPFELIERSRVEEILREQEFQVATLSDSDSAVELGHILAVRQLVLGSVGRLFERIVVTVRVVDVEDAKIILAETIYTDETRIVDDVQRLAYTIGRRGADAVRSVTPEGIRRLVTERRYIQAKEDLDRYIQRSGMTPVAQELTQAVIPHLADEYAREADKLRRRRTYSAARELVGLAIALKTDERLFQLRDRIDLEERQYEQTRSQREELAVLRAQERRERAVARIGESGWESYVGYLGRLSLDGVHIAASMDWTLDPDLTLPTALDGAVGLELWAPVTLPMLKSAPGVLETRHQGYLGSAVRYLPGSPSNTLVLEAYLSPLLAGGFKVANLALCLGLDGGVWLELAETHDGGYRAGASISSLAAVDLKIARRIGLTAVLRPGFVLYPSAVDQSHAVVRLALGLTL